MANNFQITISAVDNTTRSVRNINNSLSHLTRPVSNLRRSVSTLGKEISRNPAAKAMMGITKAAKGAALSVAKIAAPMAALTGVASIAGVAALVTEWGRLGFEISKTSQTLGLSSTDLQSLRGAAQMAGVATEALDGSLKTLGDTLQDSLYGRNQNAFILLNKLGISVRRTADGSIDTVRAFKDMANWMAKTKSVQQQNLVARTFGLEAALPLLRKGAAGIEEYQRKVAEFGGVATTQGIKAAEEFGLNLSYLEAAGYGLKVSIGSTLLPVMLKLTEAFTGLISRNREAIAAKIGEWADRFAKWIENVDWNKVLDKFEKFGNQIAWIVEKISALIDKLQSLEKVSTKIRLPIFNPIGTAIDFVKDLFPSAHAAVPARQSVTGTINYSGVGAKLPLGIRTNNPLNLEPRGQHLVFDSREDGLRAGVRNVLKNYRGLTLAQYVNKYAIGNRSSYLSYLSQKTGISPNQVPNLSDPRVLAPLISAQVNFENGGKGYDKAEMDAAINRVVVEFQNAPPGMRATAKADKGGDTPIKINYAMPTLSAG